MEPNLRVFTDEEHENIMQEIYILDAQGRLDEAMALRSVLPMAAMAANHYKKQMGIKALIESGANLSRAVERYGEDWLKEDE